LWSIAPLKTSIAGLMITTEAIVAEEPKTETHSHGGGAGGGMGDVGGMF
jgi:chaperonin GroEL